MCPSEGAKGAFLKQSALHDAAWGRIHYCFNVDIKLILLRKVCDFGKFCGLRL